MERARKSRQLMQTFACPTCGAPAGTTCSRQDGTPRKSQHVARAQAYQSAYGTAAWSPPSRNVARPA